MADVCERLSSGLAHECGLRIPVLEYLVHAAAYTCCSGYATSPGTVEYQASDGMGIEVMTRLFHSKGVIFNVSDIGPVVFVPFPPP